MSNPPARWTVDANVILRYLLADNKDLTAQALAFFQAMHNIRCRGFSLLQPMLTLLLTTTPRNTG